MHRNVFAAFVLLLLVVLHAEATQFTVNMQGSAFSPSTISIAKGDSIVWVNLDSIQHNSVSGSSCTGNGIWSGPLLSLNQKWTNTFNTVGSFPYFCQPHCGFMTGTVTVTNAVANVAPSVTVTNPSNNAVIAANTSFQIGVSASDSDGTVTNVAFAVGGTIFTNRASAPYLATTNLSAGSYTISAIASDNSGAKTTNSISITVNAPPTISLNPNGPYTVSENGALTFNVVGNDTDTLTISSTNLPSGATLTGTGNTRSFSWTPNYGQSYASPYSVTFSASDGINSAVSVSTTISVSQVLTPINLSSVVRSGNQTQFHVSGLRLTRTNFVQVSTNLPAWISIKTNVSTNTAFDFIQTNSAPQAMYRVLESR